jgi:hypothetical protein
MSPLFSQAELVLQFRDPSMQVMDELEAAMLEALESVSAQEGTDGRHMYYVYSHTTRILLDYLLSTIA